MTTSAPAAYAPYDTHSALDTAGTPPGPHTGHALPPAAASAELPTTTAMELNSVTPPTTGPSGIPAPTAPQPTPSPQSQPQPLPLPPAAAFPGPLAGISGGTPLATPVGTVLHTPAGTTGRAATGGPAVGSTAPRPPFAAGLPGVVGGSPVRGVPAPRSATGGPFTQGGAGLLRPGTPATAPALAPASAPRTSQGPKRTNSTPPSARSGSRLRHPTEDEATWTAGQQPSVPPVVNRPPH
ncbi:hypothetical protein ACH4SP_34005 [Streptomyces sp. NPDC021093]|uniref:hypothetical protein n=1 Tax=Streptomyces sp. NPDC021093 TaxID=3365112 RepID=UPI0037937993